MHIIFGKIDDRLSVKSFNFTACCAITEEIMLKCLYLLCWTVHDFSGGGVSKKHLPVLQDMMACMNRGFFLWKIIILSCACMACLGKQGFYNFVGMVLRYIFHAIKPQLFLTHFIPTLFPLDKFFKVLYFYLCKFIAPTWWVTVGRWCSEVYCFNIFLVIGQQTMKIRY